MQHALIIGNPSPKKKGRKTMAKKQKKKAARKNPQKKKGMVEKTIMPALVGGGAAIGANLAFAYLEQWLPAEVKTGNMKYLAEGGLILALGMVLENAKVGDKKTRETAVTGALTVVGYKMLEAVATEADLLPADIAAGGIEGYTDLSGYEDIGKGLSWANTAQVYKGKR